MKRIIQIALLISCVLGLGLGQTAFAAQFTITVPVNLTRMPAVATHVEVKVFLLCGVRPPDSGAPEASSSIRFIEWDKQVGGPLLGKIIVGVGQQIRSIDTSTGEFHSSIPVSLNVAQGYYPNNVYSYVYRFRFKMDPNSNSANFVDPSSFPAPLDNNNVTSYYGTFLNPALAGHRCDDSDFTK